MAKTHLPTLPEIARSSPLSIAQLKDIEDLILKRGNFSRERTRRELAWFCRDLGIDDYYFKYTPLRAIAKHIEFFRATRIIAESSGGQPGNFQFIDEQAENATYLGEDDYEQVRTIKQRIEEHFPVFRLHSYRSRGYPLRIYLVTRPVFRGAGEAKPSFEQAANLDFLKNSPAATIERYRGLWTELQGRHVPLVRFSELPDENETRVMVGLERDAAPGFLTNFTFILKKYQIHILREYAEPFADGTVIFSFYLSRVENRELPQRLEHDINMAAIMPRGRLAELFFSGQCAAAETMFAFAAEAFAHQFLTTYTEEYLTLSGELEGKPELQGLLGQFKTHLAKDTYHEDRINGAIIKHRGILRLLYEAFVQKFVPSSKKRQPEIYLAKARERIAAEVTSEIERHILEALLAFNQSIQKTNFFKSEKICLSFRLDPSYLSLIDYPERPFGIFFIFGKGFRGFHVRFRDISRGGVRMVRSPSQADYDLNSDFIFDENYNLALTQQHKNKDIPEGGSKGTILLGREYQDKGEMIFKQYIDGLLDLLLPHSDIVDLLGREEIIFLGPDEGTAELMNWAALRARERGYRYWKAFTTGKKPELGGIPHDTYGMTTNGVREFVKGIQEELGWKEEEVTKFQTGGPDGDLGSNEILLSREKMLAVVDGSGVLYDPKGIDREELERLARKRRTIADFDRKKLSPEGFVVLVSARDAVLPDGTVVRNGADFRNRFHFFPKLKADLFVPCGGRPRAITIANWQEFFNEKGVPRAKAIVEGANLFITQEARLRLEEKGVILFKDSSANKGGVTSSSLEVLAALALSDDEFTRMMTAQTGGAIPPFRERYIAEIIAVIRSNARREFKAMWEDREKTARPLSLLSDVLSDKINQVTDRIAASALYDNAGLREAVIRRHCPLALIETIGIEKVMERVPEIYLRAVFASALASGYVYEKGLAAGELDFYDYVSALTSPHNS